MKLSTSEKSPLCLVLGGLGFIGSNIASSLVAAGFAVRIFDRDTRHADRSEAVIAGAEFLPGDLEDPNDVRRAVKGAQFVFHAAYATVPRTAAEDPKRDVASNVVALLDLLEAIESERVCRRIVYLSSGGTVYGPDAVNPITEEQPTNPISAYGVSKLACEKYAQLYADRYGFDAVILRLSNPYGAGQKVGVPQGVIGHFLKRIACSEELEVWGDGTVVRDYFLASDLQGLMPSLASASEISGVFNIGSGTGHSILELLEVLKTVTQVKFSVTHLPAQSYDAPRNVLNVDKAKTILGWHPSTTFEAGVAATWATLRKNKELD